MDKNDPKLGRPTKFCQEYSDLICDGIANGKSMVAVINEHPQLPSYVTIAAWLIKGEQGIEPFNTFLKSYVQAREIQADYLADEILDISDNNRGDTITDSSGNPRCDNEWVNRSKLRVDARKWVASKLRPKKYGDFNRSELSGPNGSPIQTQPLFIIDAGQNPYNKPAQKPKRNKAKR